MNKNRPVRVRYAPSPTGYLHIGNARTALFNYLFARHYDGKFIIRIEDTDIERNIEGGEKSQLDNLQKMGISWDESIDVGGEFGPYSQLERHAQGIYTEISNKLIEEENAYRCFCTAEELELEAVRQKENGQIPKYNGKCRHLSAETIAENLAQNKPFSIRYKVQPNKTYEWNDIVKGLIKFNSNDVSGDFNIIKQNGIPTYNFAVVVDDHQMEISHVLRGEDHISNTPKQLMIYEAMGVDAPIFGHMTLIVNASGKKLSKRDTDVVQFIEDYLKLGYVPDALFNFISLLGWSPVGTQEIFTQAELFKEFTEERLSKSPAMFDTAKLNWINSQYLKKMEETTYLEFILPFLQTTYPTKDIEFLNAVALLYKDGINFGQEIVEVSQLFFSESTEIEKEAIEFIKDNNCYATIEAFKQKISQSDNVSVETLKAIIKEIQIENEVKGKLLFMPVRIAATMQMHGPDLTTSISLLGKEKVLMNIEICLNACK